MLPALLLLVAVSAAPDNPYLVEARDLARALRFGDAITRLEVARTVPSLDAAQRREVLELLARCQVAEGRRADALATFTVLLRDEPGFALDRDAVSPKIVEVFDEAKGALYPPDYVRVEEVPAPAGFVRVRVADPWGRVTRVVRHQRRDGGPWQAADVERDGAHATFPLVVAAGGAVDWYLEALGDAGAVVGGVASASAPRVVEALKVQAVPRTAPAPSRARTWVGWTLVGLAAVSAGVATGLQVSGWNQRQVARDASRPPGDWADTARAAEASGVAQTTTATALFVSGGVLGAAGVGVLAW